VDISFLCESAALGMQLQRPLRFTDFPQRQMTSFAQQFGLLIVDKSYIRHHRINQLNPKQLKELKPYLKTGRNPNTHLFALNPNSPGEATRRSYPNAAAKLDTPSNPNSEDNNSVFGEESDVFEDELGFDEQMENFEPGSDDMSLPPPGESGDSSEGLFESDDDLFDESLDDFEFDNNLGDLEVNPSPKTEEKKKPEGLDDDPFSDDFDDFGDDFGDFDDFEFDDDFAEPDSSN
jgi:hypothetical protein